ncbi:MAG: 50S ribosomal protein L14 [Mycoplasmataceae bacterium]|jgi:large subunit ribosomal protein L14|nr:50S ribosomal protein L14 [Mycoplasmataceae bacterium]
MVQLESRLKVADNTGAKEVGIMKIMGNAKPHYAKIGDIVKVAIKKATPTATAKKGTMSLAVIVRTKKGLKRENGVKLSFSENACVLIKEDKNPKGTRIFGPIARELREKGYAKIISLAPEVV